MVIGWACWEETSDWLLVRHDETMHHTLIIVQPDT